MPEVGDEYMHLVMQLRELLPLIKPELLAHADRAALLDLYLRAIEVKTSGGGAISVPLTT